MSESSSKTDIYQNLQNLYFEGKIKKHDYIGAMHNLHQALFSYQSLLKNSEIDRLEIKSDRIIATLAYKGIKFYLDRYDSRFVPIEIINFGAFEPIEKKILDNLASKSQTIADIGANIGWYTMRFSKFATVKKIFAFEAIPRTFDYLVQHVRLNDVEKAVLINKAILDVERKVTFNWTKAETGSASLKNIQEREVIEKIEVPATTIDKYFLSNNIKLDFIKCDVEGSELLVFKGAQKYLRKFKPFIFCELLRKWAAKFDYHPNDVIDLLKQYGYECFIISEATISRIDEINDGTQQTNFLFLNRKEHINTIKELGG
ncbi:MAG: hypothetical protein CMK56_03675 [Proteobacteria bacterium]|nr:hypothetical protein [Pseudomonadota bacterium]